MFPIFLLWTVYWKSEIMSSYKTFFSFFSKLTEVNTIFALLICFCHHLSCTLNACKKILNPVLFLCYLLFNLPASFLPFKNIFIVFHSTYNKCDKSEWSEWSSKKFKYSKLPVQFSNLRSTIFFFLKFFSITLDH